MPLADFTFESFAQPEIARLEELRLTVLEERIDAELEAGRDAELVGELEPLVAEHPLRERLRAQLMLALYRSGRQAEALQAYQDARSALVDELGIEPSPELQPAARLDPAPGSALDAAMAARRRATTSARSRARCSRAGSSRFSAPTSATSPRSWPALRLPGERGGLTRVSQYVSVMRGSGPLYDELHTLLEADGGADGGPPLLRRAAAAPARARRPHQLIVTTSFDLASSRPLERGEEFDVVCYIASGRDRGRFCHIPPDGPAQVITIPNTYTDELSLERRTIILKLHGRVDHSDARELESFVVTEDDYIDYLAQSDVSGALPVGLNAKLRRSHFLFLGYKMPTGTSASS